MRECDSEGEISLPRPRTLAFSSLAVFKTSKFQTRLRISCENLAFLFFKKKGEARDHEWSQRNTIIQRRVELVAYMRDDAFCNQVMSHVTV